MKLPKDQTDLELFHKLFNEEKFKRHTGKIEYRVANLESEMERARKIIKFYKLKLDVISDGNLASFRAFDVKEVAA